MYDWRTRRALLAFLCIGFVLIPVLLLAQHCDKVTSKTGKKTSLLYLERYPEENWEQECLASAINRLASERGNERAARVLIRYLDYYWQAPECKIIHGGRCMGPPYPAINSLMAIGKASLPYVLEVLKSGSVSQRARENAVDVYYYFVRDDTAEGVAALRWEADRAGGPEAKDHLLWAASSLANKWCYPFEKTPHNCEAALAGTLPFNVVEDTRAVYEAVVLKEPSPWAFEEYAIAKRTVSERWSERLIRGCISVPSVKDSEYDSGVTDFMLRNRTPELLGRMMAAQNKPYVLLDDAKVLAYRKKLRTTTEIAPNDLAPDYQFGTSGPLILVSRVGFSKHGTIAIVYVQHECPYGCSGGAVHVLSRHANFWSEEVTRECK